MTSPNEMLDDVTYIQNVKHITCGMWQQYDVRLAARGYGWEMMLCWADYMASADLDNISQVTTSAIMGAPEEEHIASYQQHGCCVDTPQLLREQGVLSIAGISRVLGGPLKIVWINQTCVLRLFTMERDEERIRRYVETMVRRTFDTPDAMKLGQPIPGQEQSTPQTTVEPPKKAKISKNVLGIIAAGVMAVLGFGMMTLGIVDVTETIPRANVVERDTIEIFQVYYFEEVTVIDSVDNLCDKYYEDLFGDFLTQTDTDADTVDASDVESYLVSYVGGDGDTVYTVMKFENYGEMKQRCRDYVEALSDGTATEGDLVISGCFHGWDLGSSWYANTAVGWFLEQRDGQGDFKNWAFYYEDAQTIADYRRMKLKENIVPSIVGIALLGLGIFWMIRIQSKRKGAPVK